MRRLWAVSILHACLVLASGAGLSAQEGFLGWVGLYDPDRVGWLENQNRLSELCRDAADVDACHERMLAPAVDVVPLHTEADPASPRAGDIVVAAVPGRGLIARFLAADAEEATDFTPDLYLQDWGYGPYFHQTVVERRGGWVRLPPGPWATAVWLRIGDDFAATAIHLQAGDIVELRGQAMYVVSAGADELLLRPEQLADHWCEAGEPPPLYPAEPVRYGRRELVDARGHLIVRPKYLKGC